MVKQQVLPEVLANLSFFAALQPPKYKHSSQTLVQNAWVATCLALVSGVTRHVTLWSQCLGAAVPNIHARIQSHLQVLSQVTSR